MNYVMLVCSEDAPIPDNADTQNAMEIEDWISLCGERRIYGEALKGADTAKTVRVRDGETVVSDGPYTETKEFVAGFDLLDCEDLDAAIALAAAHPVTSFRMVELRPIGEGWEFSDELGETLTASRTDTKRFMVMVCVNGIPEPDEVEAQVRADGEAWSEELRRAGKLLLAAGLASTDTATTVRYRNGETLLSDGPFVETKEFLAGFCVVACADLDEAVAIAARNPLAAFHRVEVREMFGPEDWAALEAESEAAA